MDFNLRNAAFHEAGHTVMALSLGHIGFPRLWREGGTWAGETLLASMSPRVPLIHRQQIGLAGHVAEAIYMSKLVGGSLTLRQAEFLMPELLAEGYFSASDLALMGSGWGPQVKPTFRKLKSLWGSIKQMAAGMEQGALAMDRGDTRFTDAWAEAFMRDVVTPSRLSS